MKTVLKLRWAILVIWIALAVLFTVFQPNINKIITEKGQGTVSEKYMSNKADKLLSNMSNAKGESAILVFNNAKKLTETDLKGIKAGLVILERSTKEVGLMAIIDPFNTPAAKGQLLSKDGTTLLASIIYEKNAQKTDVMGKKIEEKLKNVAVDHYITGGDFIKQDFMTATFKGVDKSAVLTVIFILLVLFLVFRSVATPLVSIASVGIAYLCSMGIVSQLIYNFNFPVTNLTQMFLILVLFGIGTDYNILLFNRFREELSSSTSVDEAIIRTYKTAGKTVLFSGLTVFIAFASLSFAEFDVYRSGNAVAIGIVVLFIELVTLTPFFMKVLGQKLFWPSHNTKGHKESKIWEKVTSASVKHPILTILVIIAIMAPVLYFNNHNLSFDNLKEMNSTYPSVKAYNIVSDHFSQGKTMPTTVVLQNEKAMNNSVSLAVLDKLTEKIRTIKGVKGVSGPTQPLGLPIKMFYPDSKTFYIPDVALKSADFNKSLDAYMSMDRKTVKLLVTLANDPYSSEAIKTVGIINNTIESQLEGTLLSKAEFGTGGESSKTNDLKQIATNDITKTQIIVLIGIFLVLILVIRSFWIPVYIILSLMAAYYTAITFVSLIVKHIFKLDGIAWNVPFFSFVIIVALGVDYSIFLLTRYKEYSDMKPWEAIVKAAKNTGGVVISAAIILAGTFLTLYPSGIQILMQMALSVSIGLVMLSMIMLPIAIPAMISLPHVFKLKKVKN